MLSKKGIEQGAGYMIMIVLGIIAIIVIIYILSSGYGGLSEKIFALLNQAKPA